MGHLNQKNDLIYFVFLYTKMLIITILYCRQILILTVETKKLYKIQLNIFASLLGNFKYQHIQEASNFKQNLLCFHLIHS